MQKDITQKELEGYNDVFADIYLSLIHIQMCIRDRQEVHYLITEAEEAATYDYSYSFKETSTQVDSLTPTKGTSRSVEGDMGYNKTSQTAVSGYKVLTLSDGSMDVPQDGSGVTEGGWQSDPANRFPEGTLVWYKRSDETFHSWDELTGAVPSGEKHTLKRKETVADFWVINGEKCNTVEDIKTHVRAMYKDHISDDMIQIEPLDLSSETITVTVTIPENKAIKTSSDKYRICLLYTSRCV